MRILPLILLMLTLLTPLSAHADRDIDDVADGWVEDQIGREPAMIDGFLTAPKDLLVGRQVSDTMGGILGRIKEKLLQEEGSFGRPNRRRGPCGAAAVRQASGIASDSAHSQLFRTFAGNATEVFGAIPGLIAQTARFLAGKALEEAEKEVRGYFREQEPEEYTLSKSQEGCQLEMRVVWKKGDEKYFFMILGDCDCNEVRCWNFEDREIQLGRFSVVGEGRVIPRIQQQSDGSKEIKFSIGRVTSFILRADCCDDGQYGTSADPYWVNLGPIAHATPTPPSRPTTGGTSRPTTGTSTGNSSGSDTSVTPPAQPQPEPIDPNDPGGIGVRPPEMTEPVNVPDVPEGPLCEEEKRALVDAAFTEEHKANRNALRAAHYVVDLAYAEGHHPEAPQRLQNELHKWIDIREHWIRIADQITTARKAIQALETKECDPPATGAGTGTGTSTGTTGGGGTATGGDSGTSGTGDDGKPEAKTDPCPQCNPIRQKLEKAKADKKQKETELREKRQSLTPLDGQINQAQQRVNRLRNNLAPERGVGAESTDVTTGITTSAYDTGDGRVRIAQTDAEGNLISEEFRTRTSNADRRAQLERAEEALEALNDRKDTINNQIRALEAEITKLTKTIADLTKQLADCIKKCKNPVAKAPKTAISTGSNATQGASQNNTSLGGYIEEAERNLGRQLSPAEIKNYEENPEELERTLGHELGDDIEIELEDARTSDGTNAFSVGSIEDIGRGYEDDSTDITVSSGTPLDYDGKRPDITVKSDHPEPDSPPLPDFHDTAPTIVNEDDTRIIDSSGAQPPPAPHFDFNPMMPLQPLVHIMFGTECPQQGKSMPVSATDNRPIKVEVVSNHEKFSTKVTQNNSPRPVIESQFTCNVPGTGTFVEQVKVKMTDPKTSQSITSSYELRVQVNPKTP